MRKIISMTLLFLACLIFIPAVFPHCQIPCGIYNDELRFNMITEHILTIEKSMKQIEELSKKPEKNFNQIVRWVLNKEQHADEIAHIVTYYFLTQRIKLVDEKDVEANKVYLAKIALLHELLVYTMKAKQTTNLDLVDKLRVLLKSFRKTYSGQGFHSH